MASFQNLEENLRAQGDSLEELPYVLQYNKRDLPNCAPEQYMEFLLSNRGGVRRPSFAATAVDGKGVFETLNMVSRLVLNKFIKDTSGKDSPEQDLVLI